MQLEIRPAAIAHHYFDADSAVFFRIFRKYFELTTQHVPLAEFSPCAARNIDLVILFAGHNPEGLFQHVGRVIQSCAPVPVLMVGSGDAFETSECLRSEVIDYLSIRMAPVEFASRVELLAKRLSRSDMCSTIPLSQHVTIDTKYQKLMVNGRSVFLSPLEYKILLALTESKNGEMSREQIVDKVWGKGFAMNSRSVDSHISRLRVKVQPTGIGIDVKRGSGYFLRLGL